MNGTIFLYKSGRTEKERQRREIARYYTLEERKKIIEHWRRKYNGDIFNHFIQIAPGADLTGKFKPKK